MKKEIISTKVRFDKTELTKSVIYKIEEDDDPSMPPMYFTKQALKFYVLDNIWDKWEDMMSDNETQDFTKTEINDNDEYLFAYLDSWNYKVTRITYQDIKY
jgi:hypothetical protein